MIPCITDVVAYTSIICMILVYDTPHYNQPQNYNLQLSKATNINRGKIDGICLVLAHEDINIPCVHEGVGRLACIPNINQPMRSKRVGLLCLGEKNHIN